MKQAVKFAKEIIRKQKAIEKTKSNMLKNDYQKSIKEDEKELVYYCNAKNLSLEKIWELAKE